MVLLIYIDLTRPAFQEEKSSPSHLRVQQKAEPQRRSDVDHMAQFAGISLIVSLYNIYKYSTLNLQTPASKVQSATYNTLLGCVGIYTQPELTTFGVWQAMFCPTISTSKIPLPGPAEQKTPPAACHPGSAISFGADGPNYLEDYPSQ